MQFPLTAVDTETVPFKRDCMVPPLVCLSYADIDGRCGLLHHTEAAPFVRRLLAGGAVIVGHGISYDAAVLMAHDPTQVEAWFQAYDDNRVHDTMVREQLIELRRGIHRPGRYGLDDVTERRLDVKLDKTDWRKWYANLRNKPLAEWPDGARRYAIDDAIATRDVYLDQENDGAPTDQYNQARADLWLHLCGAWGIKTDPARVEALAGTLETERDSLLVVLRAEGLVRADGSACMKEVYARVERAYGDACPRTPTGRAATSAEACEKSGDDVLVKYARRAAINSTLNNYVPVLRMGTVHAHYGFAETGRTTCTIYLGKGNLQNLPRTGGVRECYVPRPGYVFAGADYDGLELRTVAQVCLKVVGYSELAKALNRGEDPHLSMAALILNVTYGEVLERYKAKDPVVKDTRQMSKPANFGFAGGMGAETFVEYAASDYGVSLTVDQARELKAKWYRRWPEFVMYHQVAPMREPLVHLFSGRVRGGDLPYTELCNGPFQGLGADAAKRAGWLLCRAQFAEPKSVLYGARTVLFAHDEFLLEVRDDERAHDRANEMARLMVEGANQFLPDVPAKTKPCLMKFYSKEAEPIYDANGRLVPWPAS